MAAHGYGKLPDRAFVAFDRELDEGAWAQITTTGYSNATALLGAPPPVVWKLRLRWGIAMVLAALGAPSLMVLDGAWDGVQRRLFHYVGAGLDDENAAVRDAADQLRAGLLVGGGTGQTQLDYDAEVDWGRQQIALTRAGGPLEAAAKKLKLTNVLANVEKTTEALAEGLGRTKGDKRSTPSKRLRDALSDCANGFNAVHDEIAWFLANMPAGADHERLSALMQPMQALLGRNAPAQQAAPEPETKEGA